MALLPDGSVLAWGYNSYGEIGDGTNANRNLPVAVHGVGNVGLLTGIRSIAGGGTHSLAVRTDGSAIAWGNNAQGALGDGTTTNRSAPVAIHGVGNIGLLGNVSFVAGGFAHSLVRLNGGTALAMGLNNVGEVGDGSTTNRNLPVPIVGLTNVVSLSGGDTHSVGAQADGSAWGWGGNGGRLGDGTTTDRTVPVPVHGVGNVGTLAGVLSVSAGGLHSLALLNDGTVRAWGRNTDGELGDGTNTLRLAPVVVPGLSNIVQVGTSIFSSFALSADGRLWSWGRNADGELGLGNLVNRNTPTEVLAPAGMRFDAISPAVDGIHVVALLSQVPAPGTGVLLALGALAARGTRRRGS
jgi:alpha-tubulin suppressor-like RCC1 family protein